MSNPSGTRPDDVARGADTERYRPTADSDPVTEVIEIPAGAGPAPGAGDERRYTAPGFDAGFTQIIDRVPDDEAAFMSAPTQAFASTPRLRTAAPQAIPPRRPERPSWLIPILVVVAALIAAAILGVVLMKRSETAKASKENAVRATIENFDTAVRNGDLATLRTITCGQTRDTYASYDDKAWSDTYARVAAAKQYPVVASVDEVVVNGDHAEANVTSYMAFDPATTSIRSFDLQFSDDQWKICQSS
jgi:hypothetical protein